jgi:hypothetical protein
MSETATLKPSYHALAQPAEFEGFLSRSGALEPRDEWAEEALREFEEGFKASKFSSKQVRRATHYTLEESSSPDGKGNRLEETGEVGWYVDGTLMPSEDRKARLLK